MFGLGATELVVILIVVLLVFGPRKLPEVGSFVGKSLKDFREAFDRRDEADAVEDPPPGHENVADDATIPGKEDGSPRT